MAKEKWQHFPDAFEGTNVDSYMRDRIIYAQNENGDIDEYEMGIIDDKFFEDNKKE